MAKQLRSRDAKNTLSKMRGIQRKAERRAAADERNAAWNALSNEQKLVSLFKRPGNSRKQTAKIKAEMERSTK